MKKLSYDPKEVAINLSKSIEIKCADIPDKDILRLGYSTETKILANTALKFEGDKFSHSTLVDQVNPNQLADYALEASHQPTRGLTVVTKPNGYVGVEGANIYPKTKTEMEAVILDTLSITSNFIDNVHPSILNSIQKKAKRR